MSEAPDCKACNGVGYFIEMQTPRFGQKLVESPKHTCPACNGTGKEPAMKPLPMPPEE